MVLERDRAIGSKNERALLRCLPDDERARWAELPSLARRDDFLLGRALARTMLAGALASSPVEIPLKTKAGEKPILNGSELDISISHCHSAIAVAVAPGTRVGVDVADARTDMERVAARFFAPAELNWIGTLPPAARAGTRLQLWSLKEALLKALGCGLTFPLPAIPVPLQSSGRMLGLNWRVLSMRRGTSLAVAVDGEVAEKRLDVDVMTLTSMLAGVRITSPEVAA